MVPSSLEFRYERSLSSYETLNSVEIQGRYFQAKISQNKEISKIVEWCCAILYHIVDAIIPVTCATL